MADNPPLNRNNLRSIATYQKGILLCILAYAVVVVCQFALPPALRIFLAFGVIGLGIIATVFVFLLATKIYNVGIGVLLGVLTLIPLIGLVVLLIINGKATGILKQHGIQVGLLGATLSDIN
jgi:hypothetical protein